MRFKDATNLPKHSRNLKHSNSVNCSKNCSILNIRKMSKLYLRKSGYSGFARQQFSFVDIEKISQQSLKKLSTNQLTCAQLRKSKSKQIRINENFSSELWTLSFFCFQEDKKHGIGFGFGAMSERLDGFIGWIRGESFQVFEKRILKNWNRIWISGSWGTLHEIQKQIGWIVVASKEM